MAAKVRGPMKWPHYTALWAFYCPLLYFLVTDLQSVLLMFCLKIHFKKIRNVEHFLEQLLAMFSRGKKLSNLHLHTIKEWFIASSILLPCRDNLFLHFRLYGRCFYSILPFNKKKLCLEKNISKTSFVHSTNIYLLLCARHYARH